LLRSEDFAFSDLWDGFGEKLEDLTFGWPFAYEDTELGIIKTSCPNLRRITIHGMEILNKHIAALLSSYADQLEYCHVEDMEENELTAITSICKNVRFSAIVSSIHKMCPTLKVLGDRLDKMVFKPARGDGDFHNYDDLTNASNACINIRYLELRSCSFGLVKSIMATPKQHLKVLKAGSLFRLEEKEVKSIMDGFSKGTVGVEEFGRIYASVHSEYIKGSENPEYSMP